MMDHPSGTEIDEKKARRQDFGGRLINASAALYRWAIASLVTVNAGAIALTFNRETISITGRFATGFFGGGIVAILLAALTGSYASLMIGAATILQQEELAARPYVDKFKNVAICAPAISLCLFVIGGCIMILS